MNQNHKTQKTPRSYYILVVVMLFQGLSGLAGGIGLIGDPSGSSLSIPIEWLYGSPFDNYLIPGIILFFALGVFPILATYGIWRRRSWSWLTALLVGLMLIIWIIIEILVIGYQPSPPLQIIYGILGFIIIVLVLFPTMRNYLKEQAV